MKDEIFDYYQEVARSAFADMLHDTERNRKYSIALKEAILQRKKSGKKCVVLDIGTGSGLLAMLAAQHGADKVYTIEAFSPVSKVARTIIQENAAKFQCEIKIINKHSTDVKIGTDMDCKADILVAEVLDTELIGEGAIRTYNEAHRHLTEDDCLSIPDSACIYVQIVNSNLASAWNVFNAFQITADDILRAPEEVAACRGLHSINDLQLSQFPENEFSSVAGPFKVCDIDFSGRNKIPETDQFSTEFTSKLDCESAIIFFWWSLNMNASGSVQLSCAPHWAHPDTDKLANSEDSVARRNAIPWRDHWMQGVFYLKESLKKDAKYFLHTFHDEFSWYFNISRDSECKLIKQPMCSCLFHVVNSRNRIMQMNDTSRRKLFRELLQQSEIKSVLLVGDCNILALISAYYNHIAKIYIYQEDEMCFKSMKMFIDANQLFNRIQLVNDLTEIDDFSHLIADPHFNNVTLSLDTITEFFRVISKVKMLHKKPFTIYPSMAKVYAAPVNFLNLHKIRWPLHATCEGFDHKHFDSVIELASKTADESVEPFALWEYPSRSVGEALCIYEVNFNTEEIPKTSLSRIKIDKLQCNGIVFWMDWVCDENVISSGPLDPIKVGELINWKFERQFVHLIPYKEIVSGILQSIEIELKFDEDEDEIQAYFSYHYQ